MHQDVPVRCCRVLETLELFDIQWLGVLLSEAASGVTKEKDVPRGFLGGPRHGYVVLREWFSVLILYYREKKTKKNYARNSSP
jgi:hypothetical protein